MAPPDLSAAPPSIALGIVVGLLASFVQSLGLTIQRKSHVLNQQRPPSTQRTDYQRPLWLFGFAIFISSNILGSLFQIASLPVVILAPLGAVSLLWNAFFARLLLGDVFSPWMVVGTILIVCGAILIALFGIIPESAHPLEELLTLFSRAAFIAYFSLLGAAVLACLVVTHVAEFSLPKRIATPPPTPALSPVPSSASLHAHSPHPPSMTTSEHTPLLDRKYNCPTSSHPSPALQNDYSMARTHLLLAISYASVSGILSGMCLLFAKSGVDLLVLSLSGRNQFWCWQAWMLLLGLAAFATLQLWYLQKALVFADPTIVCPLAFCFYNISSIINGLVYFDQFAILSALKLTLVSAGMAVLLGGVWLVSFHAGSGRVDLGTWQESDNDLEDQIIGAPLPDHQEPSVLSPRIFASPFSDSEALFPSVLSTQMYSTSSPVAPGQDQESCAQSSFCAAVQGSTVKRHRTHVSFSLFQSSPDVRVSSTLNVPGGGFSIGLSPVSPGFAIVPKRRLSRFRDVAAQATMRRTVSDGDLEQPSEASGEPEPLTNSDTMSSIQHNKAKARWKWLRSVITER